MMKTILNFLCILFCLTNIRCAFHTHTGPLQEDEPGKYVIRVYDDHGWRKGPEEVVVGKAAATKRGEELKQEREARDEHVEYEAVITPQP